VLVVDLPADLRAELRLAEVEPEDPPGLWRMGELMRSAAPPARIRSRSAPTRR
jgi:hypothetical protein